MVFLYIFIFVLVFELNGFPFEHRSLHFYDDLLLFFSDIVKAQLHAMNFFLEFLDLLLAIIRVKMLLHLLFQVNLAFP